MLAMPARFALAVLAVLCCREAVAQDNVLLVIADDLGVDNVGVYQEGGAPPPTPNIDALAARGVLFRNAWANPLCSPTRACIHTGRFSMRTGVGWALGGIRTPRPLQTSEVTLPEVLDLAGSGYEHALIGKWHLGTSESGGGEASPNRAGGWSYYAGFLGAETSYYLWPRTVNGVTRPSDSYITSTIVRDALAWIRGRRGPWVCVVAFTAPHFPVHRPPNNLHTQVLPPGSPWNDPVPFYRAAVEAMDTEIGHLLAGLGPELARTNVIFMADNGTEPWLTVPPFVPAHGKMTPYEGGCNVPLIVAGPAVQGPPREEPALVEAVDVFSTVAELAGVAAAAVVPPWVTLDSVSFAPYLRAAGQASRRSTVFAEQFDGMRWSNVLDNGFATLRDDRYKLIRFYPSASTRREELYDLALDPFEQNDLLLGNLSARSRPATPC